MKELTLIGGPLLPRNYREEIVYRTIEKVRHELTSKDVTGWTLEIVGIVSEHKLACSPIYEHIRFDSLNSIKPIQKGVNQTTWGTLDVNYSNSREFAKWYGKSNQVKLKFRFKKSGNLMKTWIFHGAVAFDCNVEKSIIQFSFKDAKCTKAPLKLKPKTVDPFDF